MSTTLAKRTHREASEDAFAFQAMFPPETYKRWLFAGSLRRGRPEVGDVEHVIEPAFGEVEIGGGLFPKRERVNLFASHLDALVAGQTVTKHIYGATGFRWGERYRGVDFRGFNHELFFADADNWGAMLLIRTGPADFSQRVVTALKNGGMYRQQDGYLWANGDVKVPVPDEQTYLRLAGMPWKEPHERA
jgi:DNA polymerase/3'-5' exonuclease PolX